ncbi:MAG: hypothetical protein DVB23_000944 [Verrucomicrobia bacterium]|jgi:hypothetical protein|nr:MAG: hypothetical protein DVB23_000944 [Verrucomicrobiota bacterium]
MTTRELADLIRPTCREIANRLSARDLIEFQTLLDSLEYLHTLTISDLNRKMKAFKPPEDTSSTPAADLVAPSLPALQALEELYADVKTWAEPDYDAVHSRVDSICQPLKKADLLAINRQFTGRGASSDSKAALIQLIANPILMRLENRFMFLS